MTKGIEPTEADEGYYWSTHGETIVKVETHLGRKRVRTFEGDKLGLDYFDGVFVPMDPPEYEENEREEEWPPHPSEIDNCPPDEHRPLFDGPPESETGRQLGRCAKQGCTVTLRRDGDGGYEVYNDPEEDSR